LIDQASSQESGEPAEDVFGIAGRLQQVLAHAGLSQTELARRLGLSAGYVSEVVRGIKRPGTEFFIGIRRELKVSIDWLLSGEGAMVGGVGIRHELLRAIRLQVEVARAAVVDNDPVARALLVLIREGQLQTATSDPQFVALLERLAPQDGQLDLAVELYNGHLWASDPVVQRRNILAAAVAHFEARKPVNKMAALTGSPSVQVNLGKKQRVAGRDYHQR